MIETINYLLTDPAFKLLSVFLMGLIINLDFCPLAGDIAILSYVSKEAKSARRTFLHVSLYALGRIVAYSILSMIIFFGLNQLDLSYIQENGEKFIGIAILIFGIFSLIRNKDHCHEHEESSESKEYVSRRSYLGSFLWGISFSLAFCPHSAAIFFGIFVPMTISSFNPLLPILFGLGASSLIIIFSLLISTNRKKMESVIEKLEEKEKTTKHLVAIIFIIVGIFYLIN